MSDLGFEDFQWDLETERHTSRRGLRPAIVTGKPKAYANREGHRGTHMVIGPDRRGRFWTLIMLRARNSRWRLITAWPSKPSEIARYREEE